jgi:hypothetical protein
MRLEAFVLACWACVGHTRRVQLASQQIGDSFSKRHSNPSKAIETILLALSNPTAGHQIAGSGHRVGSHSTMMGATATIPERTIPGAGVKPDWANKATPKANFAASNLEVPDLTGLVECPLTRWDSQVKSVEAAQEEAREAVKTRGAFPLEIEATEQDNAKGAEYFKENKDKIIEGMKKHGAVWLRGFELTKDFKGYRQFWEELGLMPCLDPIHSSGLRKFASERDALYEEVNKPALRQHYIGLHQESTAKRTAAAGAFVCFKRATQEGGRFIVADGASILAEMETDTLKRLYDNGVRISVSNLDLPFKEKDGITGMMREGVKSLVESAVAPKFDMDLEMMYEADGKPGRLQAVETKEPPINRHPETGVPVWFCNAHNHIRYLRIVDLVVCLRWV